MMDSEFVDPAAVLEAAYMERVDELRARYRGAENWRQRMKIRYQMRMLRRRYVSGRVAHWARPPR